MKEQKRAGSGPEHTAPAARAAQADALAEIQARLELCEENLAQSASGDGPPARRHSAGIIDEATEIERLLEDMMRPPGPETDPARRAARDTRPQNRRAARGTDLGALYREEEKQAAELADSEAARQQRTRKADPSASPPGSP